MNSLTKTFIRKIIELFSFIEFTIFKIKWLLLFIVIFVFVLFKPIIEKLLTRNIVAPYLAQIKFTQASDILFCVLAGLLVTVFINRIIRNYRVSPFKVVFYIILSAGYLYYRNYDNAWEFYNLKTAQIKFFDLILINAALQISLLIRNNISCKPADSNENITPFILDLPLDEDGIDLLKRTPYAKDIANRLNATSSKKSISIGIHGEWGLGKSSFFRIIKNELKKDTNNILIDFNPWRGYKGNALSIDFFQALSQSVGVYNELLQTNLKEYGETLLNINDTFLSSTIKLASSITRTGTIEKQYKEINLALEKLNKKWYFFIDDLDRLSSDEIIEVIKLIRNSADFYNLRFILAYDKNYLISALKKLTPYNYEAYLEKIILYEYPLLPIGIEQINNQFNQLLNKYCHSSIKDTEINLNKNFAKKRTQTTTFLLTLRDVKRFANVFIPAYNKDHMEVDFVDFLNLELLRFKYPSIIYQLYFGKGRFLTERHNLLRLAFATGQEGSYAIETFIDQNADFLQIGNINNKNKLIILLRSLFVIDQTLENSVNDKSIMRSKNFSYYFRKEIALDAISHEEFEFAINSSIDNIKDFFKRWIQERKRAGITDKLIKYDIFKDVTNQSDYEKIITAIFYLGNFPKAPNDNYWGYSDDDLFNKLNPEKAVKLFYNGKTEDFKTFILSFLEASVSPFKVESDLLSYYLEKSYLNFVITHEEAEMWLVKFYDDYCKIANKTDSLFWNLYHKCVKKVVSKDGLVAKEYLPEAIKTHQKFVFKSLNTLKSYMENVIRLDGLNQSVYSLNENIKIAFKSYENFIEQLKTSKYISESFVEEFILFYEAFAKDNFKQYVSFDFHELEVQRWD